MIPLSTTDGLPFGVLSNDVDLLVLGGLGVDIATRVPALPMTVVDSVMVPVDLRIGNTGAGVALAAHAIGLRVAVVDTLGEDPPGDVVRVAMDRAGIKTLLLPDPRGTRRSVSLIDPYGQRMSLSDPRGPWTGPAPLNATELVELALRAQHVHVSIMDWVLDLLPALAGTGRPVSTDLHDWDGSSEYHRPFGAAADMVFVSGTRLPNVANSREHPRPGTGNTRSSNPRRAGSQAARGGLTSGGRAGYDAVSPDRRHQWRRRRIRRRLHCRAAARMDGRRGGAIRHHGCRGGVHVGRDGVPARPAAASRLQRMKFRQVHATLSGPVDHR
jgi:sugar/nucleoside kinase (ribokinase family)